MIPERTIYQDSQEPFFVLPMSERSDFITLGDEDDNHRWTILSGVGKIPSGPRADFSSRRPQQETQEDLGIDYVFGRRDRPTTDRDGVIRQTIEYVRGSRDRHRSRSPNRSDGGISSADGQLEPYFYHPHDDDEDEARTDSPNWLLDRSAVPTADCICPINTECPRRADNLLDCRKLVLETEVWLKSLLREATYTLPDQPGPLAEEREVAEIKKLCDHIDESPALHRSNLAVFEKMIKWIHQMANSDLTQDILDRAHIIPRLQTFLSEANKPVRTAKRMPPSIAEDLNILLRKWEFGDLSSDPHRGTLLVTKEYDGVGKPKTTRILDPTWPYKRSAKFYGHGHLINGQMFENRLHLRRDGGHAPTIAGIYGSLKGGARSVVMGYHDPKNKNYYADVDIVSKIWNQGTARKREPRNTNPTNLREDAEEYEQPNDDGVDLTDENFSRDLAPKWEPTKDTQKLMRSVRLRNEIRVFRSAKLAPIVGHRPRWGFRYDGLYIATDQVLQNERMQIWSFLLERVDGQAPIRGATRSIPGPVPRRVGRHRGR